MKKWTILILGLILLLLCLPGTAEEETATYSCGDYTYLLNEDGTATIVDWNGNNTELGIADTLDGHTVHSIGDAAFSDCSSLISISIPDSVESIGANPFRRCKQLTIITVSPEHPYLAVIDNVLFSKADRRLVTYPIALLSSKYEIPNGIQSIGDSAFDNCASLTEIVIPDTVTSIADSAFTGCSSLTDITIPDSVTSIGSHAFSHCTRLSSITLSDSVTFIGDAAFCFCDSLTRITIPDSVEKLEGNPFHSCGKLKEIIVSPDNPYLAVIDNVLFCKADRRLVTYPTALTASEYEIPNGIYSISESAFSYSILTRIAIPNTVACIGSAAFYRCSRLTSVSIPDGVTSIEDYTFSGCSKLTSVTIPDSVTSIGNAAFANCDSLSGVTLPDNVTSIGNSAFSTCVSLTDISIPDSVSFIGGLRS